MDPEIQARVPTERPSHEQAALSLTSFDKNVVDKLAGKPVALLKFIVSKNRFDQPGQIAGKSL